MKKIALIFGGTSSEYEVSLASASGVLAALHELDYQVFPIGITRGGDWFLTDADVEQLQKDTWQTSSLCQSATPQFKGQGFWLSKDQKFFKPDVLLPILHGGSGEDGSLQGLFEMMALSYAGCGVAASALCMNKFLLHKFADTLGIKSAATVLLDSITDQQTVEKFIKNVGLPIFVKPNEAGSSKGISKVTEPEQLPQALAEAFRYSRQVILQKAVSGIEIGCGILGNHDLQLGACDEISLVGQFFDYVEKYQLLTAKITVPAQIPAEISEKIQVQAQRLYQHLGCRGLARIDFFLTDDGTILLNEVNTLPGFTPHSRFPAMMAAAGISYNQVLEKLITLAEEAHHEKHLLAIS